MIQKISYGWVTVGKIYKELHYVQNCQILSKTYDTCFCSNILQSGLAQLTNVTIMYRNNELSSTMSWVGCFLKDSELFIVFAKNSRILLKISVNPIILNFMYLIALNLLVNNQLNSSLRHINVTPPILPLTVLLSIPFNELPGFLKII